MSLRSRFVPTSIVSAGLLAFCVGVGCLGPQQSSTFDNSSELSPDIATDTAQDAVDVGLVDVGPDLIVPDIAPDDVSPEVLAPETHLPASLEVLPVVVDWSWQSTPSAGGTQHREALSLVGGDVVIAFTFGGETVIEGRTLGNPASPPLDGLMRVTPAGDVLYAVTAPFRSLGVGAAQPDGSLLFSHFLGEAGFMRVSSLGETSQAAAVGLDKWSLVTAITATTDGGWLVAGRHSDHPDAKIVIGRLDSALALVWTELATGTADAVVRNLIQDGDGFFALGSFGFYPSGVTLTFGGTQTLAARSPDDDIAYDVFAARWSAPGVLTYATMIQHYENEARPRTLVELGPDTATFRLDNAKTLAEVDGVFSAGYGDGRYAIRVELNAVGRVSNTYPVRHGAQAWPSANAYVAAETPAFVGETWTLGDDGPTFNTPTDTEEYRFSSHVFSQATPDGIVKRAGQLIARETGTYKTARQSFAPLSDGSWLVYFRGTSDITLGDDGPTLVNAGEYERMVLARVRFGAPPE